MRVTRKAIHFPAIVDQFSGDAGGLVAKLLGSQRQWTCASPDYLARKGGAPASIDELRQRDCIVGYRRNSAMKWSVLDGAGVPYRFAPPATYEVGDGDAVLAMALAGCGICQLPAFMVRQPLLDGTLVSVLDDNDQHRHLRGVAADAPPAAETALRDR